MQTPLDEDTPPLWIETPILPGCTPRMQTPMDADPLEADPNSRWLQTAPSPLGHAICDGCWIITKCKYFS